MSDNKESKKINIEIDGKKYEALPNQTIIQIADANGIYIPRFCYHPKLSVAANCRMCLVDVDNARRSSPACATPVMDGMVVRTRSEKSLQMQKDVMEFLLINHPLDCPICDQGGECELQDVALSYGNTTSEYKETKRAVPNPELGSLVSTDMTRCILCTRCVRFGEEVAGVKELGVMGRGDHSEISTYVSGDMMNSELSGNVIDLCPVGALTSKPFRFTARAWELKQYPTVSAGDASVADLDVHVYQGKVVRAVPRETIDGNTWIADRDRFEYAGLYSEDRIQKPMIKKNGAWIDVSWEEALDFVKVAIEQTIEKDGADKISAIVSENSTSEEMFLMKRLLNSIGSENIDSRVRQSSISDGVTSGVGIDCSKEDIESSDFVFMLGSNLRKEQPVLNYSVKKAVDAGGEAIAWNVANYAFNYDVNQSTVSADNFDYLMISLLKAIMTRANVSYTRFGLDDVLRQIEPTIEARDLAEKIMASERPVILVGQDVVSSASFDAVLAVVNLIKQILGVRGGVLPTDTNSVGATSVGINAEHSDFSALECLSGVTDTKLLMVANSELGKDSILGDTLVEKALSDIDVVVAFSAFADDTLKEKADIILPVATHYETSGSFVDMFGKVKDFKQVIKPYADSKELWRVLRVIGNLLNQDGFEYTQISEVTADAYTSVDAIEVDNAALISQFEIKYNDICFVPESSIYDATSLVRRSKPLQGTVDANNVELVKVSRELADKIYAKDDSIKIKLYDIDYEVEYDAIVDDTLAPKNIVVPRAKMQPFLFNTGISIRLADK